MAEKYAADHRLTLDKHLSFRDLGVSAYRGKNAKEGALRAFLDAIEHNLVPPNSYLLVESLDRLSRDRILAAQFLFLQIVQAGISWEPNSWDATSIGPASSCNQRPGLPLSSTATAIQNPEPATSAAVTQIAGRAAPANCAMAPSSSAPIA